jgi:ferredoxin
MCAILAPAVFELDDRGTLVVRLPDVPDEQQAVVLDAVACCPTVAISTSE